MILLPIVVIPLLSLIALIEIPRWTRSLRQRQQRQEIVALVTASERLEQDGQVDRALAEVLAALELADRYGLEPPADLEDRRASLSRRDVEARLGSLAWLDPAVALGEALTLRGRLRSDPALTSLADPIDQAVVREASRYADHCLARARESADAGHPEAVLEPCREALRAAEALPADQGGPVRAAALEIGRDLARRHGLILEPIRGQFTLGSPGSYRTDLAPYLADLVKQGGYVVKPTDAPWAAIWDELATRNLGLTVVESYHPYGNTVNRASQLALTITLNRQGQPPWTAQAQARTRTPPPGMAVFESTQIETATERRPGIERRLYEDAREVLKERLSAIHGIPPAVPAASSRPESKTETAPAPSAAGPRDRT